MAGNVNVTPGVTMQMPGYADTVPMPAPAPTGNTTSGRSSYGEESMANIDAYLAEQCRRSGGRQYYCSNQPLTPAQQRAIQQQTEALMQQYRIYQNGTWYTR